GLKRIMVVSGVVAVAVGQLGWSSELPDHDLVHLADLFRKRHSVEQIADALLDRRLPVEVAWRAGGRGRCRHGQGCSRKRGDGNPDHEQDATHRLLLLCGVRVPVPRLFLGRGAAAALSCPESGSGRSLLVAPRVQATGPSSYRSVGTAVQGFSNRAGGQGFPAADAPAFDEAPMAVP